MDASVINRIRDETGLNYAKIAKRLDVNRENISAIITGKSGHVSRSDEKDIDKIS